VNVWDALQTPRVAGNFIVGFCTAFAAISMVDGLPQDKLITAGFIGGTIQGLLAAGREMLEDAGDALKGQLNVFAVF
jgi:hypothetical protein